MRHCVYKQGHCIIREGFNSLSINPMISLKKNNDRIENLTIKTPICSSVIWWRECEWSTCHNSTIDLSPTEALNRVIKKQHPVKIGVISAHGRVITLRPLSP